MVVNSNDSAGTARVRPANASASKPSTSILMNTGMPWRAINASSVVSGTRMVRVQACPSQPGAPSAARTNAGDAVDTVGLARLSSRSTVPALRPTACGSITTAAIAAVDAAAAP